VLADWKDQPNLKLLSLMYDLTPSDFVTGIVTEVGILPPSSVAILLRKMGG
jgi:translation initiation factor eIF-2B subunit delta